MYYNDKRWGHERRILDIRVETERRKLVRRQTDLKTGERQFCWLLGLTAFSIFAFFLTVACSVSN